MKLVEKVINVLDDRKEALVTTPLWEKKSLTDDFDKGTGDLEDMNEAVVTILRKDLDMFKGWSKGSSKRFKHDSEFLNNNKIYNSSRII